MLTPAEATFVEYYATGATLSGAAVAAGQPLNTAEQQAYYWLGKLEIVSALQMRRAELSRTTDEVRSELVEDLMALATSDISNVLYTDGNGDLALRSMNDMPRAGRRAIRKAVIVETPVPFDERPRRKITIEMHPKTDALVEAIKVFGLSNNTINHKISTGDVDGMSDDDLTALLQSVTRGGS